MEMNEATQDNEISEVVTEEVDANQESLDLDSAKDDKDIKDNLSPKTMDELKAMGKEDKKSLTKTGQTSTKDPLQTQYTPNFKFKVMEKELEVPELLRAVIKDAESEKQVREILEKAYGIDYVKNDRESIKNEYKTVKEKHTALVSGLEELDQIYQRGDLDMFFQKLEIPESVLQKYVLEKLQYKELKPEQQQAYNTYQELQRQKYSIETENQRLKEEHQRVLVERRTHELETQLSKPDIAPIVQAFDAKYGQGSFKQEVVKEGQYNWHINNKDLSAEQLVQQLIDRNRWMSQSSEPQGIQTQVNPQVQQVVQRREAPVIPVVKATGNSPAQRSFKSTEDLRSAYKNKNYE